MADTGALNAGKSGKIILGFQANMSADTIAESGDPGVLQASLVFRMALACKKRKNSNYLRLTGKRNAGSR